MATIGLSLEIAIPPIKHVGFAFSPFVPRSDEPWSNTKDPSMVIVVW